MLQYLVDLLTFTYDGVTYNLLMTPWLKIEDWISAYQAYSSNAQYSTAVRDAYEVLANVGACYALLAVALVFIFCWLFYKVVSGFTGWMRFR